MMRNHHELRTLLPWYVNGTLDLATRRELEQQLEPSALLRAELVWLRLLRSHVKDSAPTKIEQRSADAGLDTLLALIHAEQSGKVVPLRSRFGSWISAARQLPLSMGIAAAVVLSQAVILGALLDQPGPDQIGPLSGSSATTGQLLQVTFKATATEAQIRSVLSSVQGEIVSGPGALGVYAVQVPTQQGSMALQTLRNAGAVVESVTLLPGR